MPPSNVNFNVVSRSVFGTARFDRLDPEFVDRRSVEREAGIAAFGGKRLQAICGHYDGPIVNDKLLKGSVLVDYIAIDDVDNADGLTYPTEMRFRDRPSRAKYVLEHKDILVSNVRPNRGAIAFVGKRDAGAYASSGFTLLRSVKGMSAQTLFLFLKSKPAREQLVRRNRGSMYPAVLERDVFDVIVPAVPAALDRKWAALADAAFELQEKFFAALEKLEADLAAYLQPYGSPPSPFETRKGGVDVTEIRRSDAFGDTSAKRIDAEFFRSEYQQFFARVEKLGQSFALEDHYNLSTGRLLPGTDRVATLKQAVLTNWGVNWSAIEWRIGKQRESQVAAGDILLASTAHEIAYVGKKVDFVREVPSEVTASNQLVAELIVMHPKTTKPSYIAGSYVAAVLRHPFGMHQVQRCIRGLRGGHTYPQDLAREVVIPNPGRAWLDSFEAKAREAEDYRRKAKGLVLDAIADLETWLVANGIEVRDEHARS